MSVSVRRVRDGSLVDVIAPSGPFDVEGFRAGVGWLEKQGFRVRHRADVFAREGFLAGGDARRLDELHEALAAPDSDLVWAARGGYGVTRIVERLDLALVRRASKLLVGFSDLTALHGAWHRAGVPSVHGTMVARLAREPDPSRAATLGLLRTGRAAPLSGTTLHAGRASGPLAGGNLALLAAACGTTFQPDLSGCVLFLEDVGERPYRLDRMLVQCRQAGLFRGIVGLVWGDFTGCEEKDGSSSSAEVLAEHTRALGLPAIAGLPSGHGDVNWPLPFGVRVTVGDGRLAFDGSLYGDEAAA
jgi:muramoyltetrapeptide carboxypeptidase